MKILKTALTILTIIITLGLLTAAVKGDKGRPFYYQSERDGRAGGPFESSGSNSRFALTEAIVENGTFFFNDQQAKFSAPDLVLYNGKFFSLFTPGVSLLGAPFYMLGREFGVQQLGAFSINLILVLINGILIFKISRKIGTSFYLALLSGLLYIFATNALAYALTYTQHQLVTFVLLTATLNAAAKRTLLNNLIFGLFSGIGLLADLPTILMLFPLGLYVLYKNFEVKKFVKNLRVSLKLSVIGVLIGFLPFAFFFGWYNKVLTGSPTLIGQFVGRSDYPTPEHPQNKIAKSFEPKGNAREFYVFDTPFLTRKELGGLYILLISDERGWLYYSPVLAIGILGLFVALKNNPKEPLPKLLIADSLIVLTVYSMFADAYGGWAFGPRYMIPAAATVACGIGLALQKFSKNIILVILAILLIIYSSWINIIGAMTTILIPPKVEAIHLVTPIPWNYKYNLQLVDKDQGSALIYNLFFKGDLPLSIYIYFYLGIFFSLIVLIYCGYLMETYEEKQK